MSMLSNNLLQRKLIVFIAMKPHKNNGVFLPQNCFCLHLILGVLSVFNIHLQYYTLYLDLSPRYLFILYGSPIASVSN